MFRIAGTVSLCGNAVVILEGGYLGVRKSGNTRSQQACAEGIVV